MVASNMEETVLFKYCDNESPRFDMKIFVIKCSTVASINGVDVAANCTVKKSRFSRRGSSSVQANVQAWKDMPVDGSSWNVS